MAHQVQQLKIDTSKLPVVSISPFSAHQFLQWLVWRAFVWKLPRRCILSILLCKQQILFAEAVNEEKNTFAGISYTKRTTLFCFCFLQESKNFLRENTNNKCAHNKTSLLRTSSVNWYAMNFLINEMAVAFSSPILHLTTHKLGSLKTNEGNS